jgi:TolB-like protein/DNA-binding winged helix-turn-helix (wHTH) protein/Flp pilus assembly protein TadD
MSLPDGARSVLDFVRTRRYVKTPQPTSVLRFGTYELALQSGELRKAGVRIRVQQQPLKVLEILLERPGEVVTREELRSRIWPHESFGDFDQAVNVAIAKLRGVLGDSAENPRYIETLPKRGYRFIAEVAVVAPIKSAAKLDSKLTVRELLRPPLALAVVLLLVILTALIVYSRRRSFPEIRSLAVLPLESLSGDASQDYFADGMTDELITDLGQISALRVISRTSVMPYKRARRPLPEIARELHVDAVVEGTVLRSGDHVRITAQLVQVPAERHLWAQSYEGDVRDALTLQSQVAHAVAQQIRIKLSPREQTALKNKKVVDPEAYEAYLKGRYFWNKRTANGLKTAVAYFNQAIEKDSSYSQAYTGLADSYALMGDWQYGVMAPKEAFPKAKAAAVEALKLDNTLAEAHTSLAFCFDIFDWDWDSAEKEFKAAIELNPGYATAHHWYAWHLIVLGRNTEAIAEIERAANLDPLSLIISADVAEVLLVARQYDQAIQQSLRTIAMDPNFAVAHYQLGQAYAQKKMYSEAIAELRKATELAGADTPFIANLAFAYAVSGRRSEAMKLLEEVKNRPDRGFSNASEVALIYIGLGEKDQAMTWLEKAYEEHFNPSILVRPAFDPLRSDKRFQDLMRRVGLPS